MGDVIFPADTTVSGLREIVRQADAQMEDLLASALAADARANTQAYTLAGIAAAAVVAGTAYANLPHHHLAPVVALFASAAIFLIGTACGFVACRPRDYMPRGFRPSLLADAATDEGLVLRWAAQDMQDRITHNRRVLADTARWTAAGHWAFFAAVMLPATGVVIASLA